MCEAGEIAQHSKIVRSVQVIAPKGDFQTLVNVFAIIDFSLHTLMGNLLESV